MSKDHILIGKIIKPHGLKGEVKVFPFSGCPGNFNNYTTVILTESDSGAFRSCSVIRTRVQGDYVILLLEGITSRDDAEMLAGQLLWLGKGDFPRLAPGEYYWFQLQGMCVSTVDGRVLGVVTSIFNNRAQDVLVVSGRQREFLIPMAEGIIQHQDDEKRILVVAPPPGLLERDGKGT